MRGPDGVRDQIAAMLVEVLPRKTDALRRAYRLTRTKAPDVSQVSSGELAEQAIGGLGDIYVEIVNPRLMAGMERIDIDEAGYPEYRMRYSCRIYVWALAQNWPLSIERRDHTMNAVRQCLLEFPTLSTTPGDTGFLMHHDTYTEEYGGPVRAPNKAGRTWASGLCSIDMWSEESMAPGRLREPIGETQTVRIGASLVGPTESLPEDLPAPTDIRTTLTSDEEISSGST